MFWEGRFGDADWPEVVTRWPYLWTGAPRDAGAIRGFRLGHWVVVFGRPLSLEWPFRGVWAEPPSKFAN